MLRHYAISKLRYIPLLTSQAARIPSVAAFRMSTQASNVTSDINTPASKDELRHKDYTTIFQELWQKFVAHYEDFMSDKKHGLSDILETAKNNMEYLRQKGHEGSEDVSAQLKEKNEKLMDKLSRTSEASKDTIKGAYQALVENMPDAEKNYVHLKQAFKDAFEKVGDTTSDTYTAAMDKLEQFTGKDKEDYEKFYHDMTHSLEGVYNDTVDKLKEYFSYDDSTPHDAAGGEKVEKTTRTTRVTHTAKAN